MAKYDPLYRYLRRQRGAEVVLTFSEIENLLTSILPKRALKAEWWDEEGPLAGPQRPSRAWLQAGYHAYATPGLERVTFRRIDRGAD